MTREHCGARLQLTDGAGKVSLHEHGGTMAYDARPETGPGSDVERETGHLKLPAVPPVLDDGELLRSRHPHEQLALSVSAVGMILVLGIAASLGRNDLLLGAVAIWVVLALAALQASTLYTLSGLEVTPKQFPAVYDLFQDIRRRFDLPPTRLFVIHDPHPKAFALGVRAPYVIVLHSALLEILDLDELGFVLGQQCGHIRFGHTKTGIIFGGDSSSLPSLLSWLGALRNLLFAWYLRSTVTSADRAGILASGNVSVPIRAQVKLAAGALHPGEIQGANLVGQALAVSHGIAALQAKLIHLEHSTPTLIHRVEEMVAWAGLPVQRGEPAA